MHYLRGGFFWLVLFLLAGVQSGTAGQEIYGPVKYDVKDRYGKLNHATIKLTVHEGTYLVKLQVGATAGERPDWMEFAVNGEKVVRNDKYAYPYIAVFVPLKGDSVLELVMRDDYPSGLKRPPLGPKNVFVSVFPAPAKAAFMKTSLGIYDWNSLDAFIGLIERFSPAGRTLAMDAVNFQYDVPRRLDALRKLAEHKERAGAEFLEKVYSDPIMTSEIRGEAGVALGALQDKKHIPLFMRGILDPESAVGIASARALSLYAEADTQELLTKTLGQLDNLRKESAIQTISKGGWKPVSTMITLSESNDAHIAEIALAILGGMQTTPATDYLLASLADPAKGHKGVVVQALGDTKDPRAVDALIAVAVDKAKRNGLEADLAEALLRLGDKRAGDPIRSMAKSVTSPFQESRIRAAYFKLTGSEL